MIGLGTILVCAAGWILAQPCLHDIAIRRDKSGLLHKLGVSRVEDVRLVRIRRYRDWENLELLPAEDRANIRELLAAVAASKPDDGSWSNRLDCIWIVLKNGKAVGVDVFEGCITDKDGNSLYESSQLGSLIDTIARKPGPWLRNARLRATGLSNIRADFGDAGAVTLQRQDAKDTNGSPKAIQSLASQILGNIDQRRLQSIARIREEAGDEPWPPLRPNPSLECPVIYLEFQRPIQMTVLMPRDLRGPAPTNQIIYPLKEDRFLAKTASIYSERGRVLVAFIPTIGSPWYVYGSDWLDNGLAQEWKDRLGRYGDRSVPHRQEPFTFQRPSRPISKLYAEMATLLRRELDSRTMN